MQRSTNPPAGYNAEAGSRYTAGGLQAEPAGQSGMSHSPVGSGMTGMSSTNVPSGMTAHTGAAAPSGMATAAGYGAGGSAQTPVQPNMQQLSYEQFQEQVRQKQEQEQELARMALVQAGADRHSDKIRTVVQHLQSLNSEIKMAENQIQVQMDAQLRQIQLIRQRVQQAETMMQQLLGGSAAIPQ